MPGYSYGPMPGFTGGYGYGSAFLDPRIGLAGGGPRPPTAPPIIQSAPPMTGGGAGAPQRRGFGDALLGGIGDFLSNGENLLGLAQVGTGLYGAYRQGKAMDEQNRQAQEEAESRREERENERKRRANADPMRAALLARLMARGGQ